MQFEMFFTKPVTEEENMVIEKYYSVKKNQRVVYVVRKSDFSPLEIDPGQVGGKDEIEKIFFNLSPSYLVNKWYSIVKKQRNNMLYSSIYWNRHLVHTKEEKKEKFVYTGVIDEILDTKLHPMLPMISGDDDFKKRVGKFENEKESRKTIFSRKTIDGYAISKKMYFDAYRQIQFFESGEEAVLEKVSDELKKTDSNLMFYRVYMKRIVICLKKVAECCYFLDRFEEGMELCQKIIDIVNTHKINRKMLKLVYGLMGKIMIVKGEFKKAREFIGMGFILDPSSGILARAEVYLERAEKGEYYESDRIETRKMIESFVVYESFFDDLLPERISFLNQSKEWCTNDLDEIKSHFHIQLMNKNICFCRIYFFL